ncbi:MAG: hypothetical protein BGO31_14105 [Bacteroidetes bacterium 43-16]|nr:MAG: hypothetical protein BGO31_14105 [Bacteroidetes bacterium 43-16]
MNIEQITTVDQVREFLAHCIEVLGAGFHPDTDFYDYYNFKKDKEVFDPETAEKHNELMEQAFTVCDDNEIDIYQIGINLIYYTL